MSESNKRELKTLEDYRQMYEIPIQEEFYVRELVNLQNQYAKTANEHVRTKTDLMRLIMDIQKKIKLTPKENVRQHEYSLLIVCNNGQNRTIFEFFEILIPKDMIKMKTGMKTHFYLETFSGIKIHFVSINNFECAMHGKRIDNYWNLTNNIEFEKKFLEPMRMESIY